MYSSDHEEDILYREHRSFSCWHATDICIIIVSLYHFSWNTSSVTELWDEKSGKYLPIHDLLYKLCEKFGKAWTVIASSILTIIVLSGCDSVSYNTQERENQQKLIFSWQEILLI